VETGLKVAKVEANVSEVVVHLVTKKVEETVVKLVQLVTSKFHLFSEVIGLISFP
jgi:hypothetical protein